MKRLYVEQVYKSDYNPELKEMVSSYKYKVVKVVNSIDPLIGTVIHKDIIDSYCEDVEWTVEIK